MALAIAFMLPAEAEAEAHARAISSHFWGLIAHPEGARVGALVHEARIWFLRAEHEFRSGFYEECIASPTPDTRLIRERAVARMVNYENAIARLELAHSLSPHDPAITFLMGVSLADWERPERGCHVSRRDDDALAMLEETRRLDPEWEPFQVAFELSILHSRRHEFGKAAEEDERAIVHSLDVDANATVHANYAEALMMSGDLVRATQQYQRALQLAERDNDEAGRLFALWGLAAALTRQGERDEALADARLAIAADNNSMHALRKPGVFFEPAYEVLFYEALGEEARAFSGEPPVATVALSTNAISPASLPTPNAHRARGTRRPTPARLEYLHAAADSAHAAIALWERYRANVEDGSDNARIADEHLAQLGVLLQSIAGELQ